VLDGLNEQRYDNVLVGMDLFDDAGVVKVSDELAIVTTVDFFTPVVDDPFDFGAIAATNSLSDMYAMGARPISALNIVGFPEKDIPLSVLREIIQGGLSVSREAGMPIVGGHTVKANEPFFGLAVTGEVNPKRVFTNASAKPGDRLYLTKPLGSGLITTALKNDIAPPEIVAGAVGMMKKLNRAASEAVGAVSGGNGNYNCAVTDITGYGLLGHLYEMLSASDRSASIRFEDIPLMPGALDLARQDSFPGGSRANLLSVEPEMYWHGDFKKYEKLILTDAQTSGGLLIAVKPDLAEKLETEMKSREIDYSLIGEIAERSSWRIKVARK
jgi:selenide,water dikinase